MDAFVCEGVGKRFVDFPALSDITLRVAAGERVALVGPSGAGKTTLLHLLNGTLLPDVGSVRALGQDWATLSPRQARRVQAQIGTVYQQFHLVGNLKVIHNVNAGRLGEWSAWQALTSLLWPRDRTSAETALARVGVADKLMARTSELSGGQQQRVALARVLVQNPQAILADEPTASLDPERSREIMALLTKLAREDGKTLVASLHDFELARTFCERLVGMRLGRVVFDLPVDAVTPEQVAALYAI